MKVIYSVVFMKRRLLSVPVSENVYIYIICEASRCLQLLTVSADENEKRMHFNIYCLLYQYDFEN